jgi:hypothetical protein
VVTSEDSGIGSTGREGREDEEGEGKRGGMKEWREEA